MIKIGSCHPPEKSPLSSNEDRGEAIAIRGQNLPIQLQAVPGQKVLQVVGPFFGFQQDLLVQMARSPVAKTLSLGGVTTNHLNQRLLCCQVVLNHQAASKNIVGLLGKAAEFSELSKGQGRSAPQPVEPFTKIMGVFLDLFIAFA